VPKAPAVTRGPNCSSTRRGSRSTSTTRTFRIVDIRARGYGDGHIPEAVFVRQQLDPQSEGAADLPADSPQEFEALMSKLGISNNTRVIAYDERGGIYAARLWWILNYYGHSNVALLDGGWVKWAADARPTSAATPAPAPATFRVKPGTVKVATADQVKSAINNPQ
jgi:thiosulfate/3-mercaptopyruvate sulfurtransferase